MAPRAPYSTVFGAFGTASAGATLIADLPPGYTFVLRSVYGCAFGIDDGSSGYFLTVDTIAVGSYVPVPLVTLADGYQYAWGGDSFPLVVVTGLATIPIEFIVSGPMSWSYWASGFVLEGSPPWYGGP
jgi:hypothetical protein